MSDSIVDPKITDAVTQANVKVVGEAPAMALGSLYQASAHSLGLLFENAVATQQNQATIAQATTTQGVTQIYTLTAAADGESVKAALSGGGKNTAPATPPSKSGGKPKG